jgi:hypothetical protein
MKRLIEIFTSPDGDLSSKRVLSFVLIISGVVYAFIGLCSPASRPDPMVLIELVGSGVALLGVQAITRT